MYIKLVYSALIAGLFNSELMVQDSFPSCNLMCHYTLCIPIPEVLQSLYTTHQFVRFPECLNIITHGGEKKENPHK